MAKKLFLEASEWNVEAAMGWAMAGVSKVYAGPVAAKFAAAFEKWEFMAEAAKAGWKFPAASGPAWAAA